MNGETLGPPVTEPEQGLAYCPTLSLLSTEEASRSDEVEQRLRLTLMDFQVSQESNQHPRAAAHWEAQCSCCGASVNGADSSPLLQDGDSSSDDP